jgi:hypothetical protein
MEKVIMNTDFAYGFGTVLLTLSLAAITYLIFKLRAIDNRQSAFLSGQLNRDQELRDTVKRLVDETVRKDSPSEPRAKRDMFGNT